MYISQTRDKEKAFLKKIATRVLGTFQLPNTYQMAAAVSALQSNVLATADVARASDTTPTIL
jgi:hypothetical protein